MTIPHHVRMFAAVASASALVLGAAGVASAQTGSIASSAEPVFDSESEGSLVPLGDGDYRVDYTNRSGTDLVCFGLVLPEELSLAVYESYRSADFSSDPGSEEWGDPTALDPELQDDLDLAVKNGHVAFVSGDDGLTIRELVRSYVLDQVAEGDEVPSDEVLDEYIDSMLSGLEGSVEGELALPVDSPILNFVDDGEAVNWSATLGESLPEGGRAGGVVVCFDGVNGSGMVAETTYVEIEHAVEDADAGELPSEGIFGSIERALGSAS